MQQEMLYVLAVYQAGSFSKAAEKLFITQPALSIAIKKIEDKTGMPLFDRSTKPLQLTAAGHIYVQNIRDMQCLEDNLTNALQDLNFLEEGELRLAGTQYYNSHVIPATIKKYMAKYPKVKLTLLEDNSGNLDAHLEDGSVDLVLHCGKFDESKYKAYEVFKDYLLLAVPKEFAINKKLAGKFLTTEQIKKDYFLQTDCPIVPLSTFAQEPFLILTKSNDLRKRALAMCSTANFTPTVRFEVEQLETSAYLAASGLGATFLSDRMIKEKPMAKLCYYKLTSPEATRHFHAVLRKNSYISKVMQVFIEMSKETWRGSVNGI